MPKAKRVKNDTGAPLAPRRSGRIAAMAESGSSTPAATSTNGIKKNAGRKAAGGKAGKLAGGKVESWGKTGKSTKSATGTVIDNAKNKTEPTSATASPQAKAHAKKTKTNPKANVTTKTSKKTAKSTVKTPEKAKAGLASKKGTMVASTSATREAATTAVATKTTDTDKRSDTTTSTAISTPNSNTELAPATTSDVGDQTGLTFSSPTLTERAPATASSNAIANIPKDTIDPSRPIFYPSYFPHIMSNIIMMCPTRERLKFRGVSKWCNEETRRLFQGPRKVIHAKMKPPKEWYTMDKRRRFFVKDRSVEVPKSREWTIQIADYMTRLRYPHNNFGYYEDSRLLLTHTVRYFLFGPPDQSLFPPGLRTVILFFQHHPCCHQAPSTACLLDPNSAARPFNTRPRLPAPTITKVVINVRRPLCDSVQTAFPTCLDRVLEAIVACPTTVSDLTVVFPVLPPITAQSAPVLKFWDKLIDALSTKKQAIITLVDVATVHPLTHDRSDKSTFQEVHAFINTRYQRKTRTSNLQLTAMTREEYRATVGANQFRIDTRWHTTAKR